MKKVLLVEDDEEIAGLLKRFLSEYYEVIHFNHPYSALGFLRKESVSVIILDLTLPDMDGLALCTEIRSFCTASIIISSARSGIEDKLYALENGADDYLPKPYDTRELLARIKLLIKREPDESESKSLFYFDTTCSQLYFKDQKVELTLTEYEIFKLLYDHANQAISRMDIANSISKHRFDSGVESINVLIGRLRKKIEPDLSNPIYIQTIRGVGYRFSDEFASI